MKLKKAEVWIQNTSSKDVTLHDLGVSIKRGATIELFKFNPSLSYDIYLMSKREGSFFARRNLLKEVCGPPREEKIDFKYEESKQPRGSVSKSMVGTSSEEKDYIDILSEEFPSNSQPLSQEDAWNAERKKVLDELGDLEQGETGEVFSDSMFDDDDGSDDGF